MIRAAIEGWWNDLKRGHFLDVQTRVLTMQLQCKSNNIGIRNRMTILFEFTSPGGVLPSYDMETMVDDDVRLRNMSTFMTAALLMCGFFVLLEGVELFKSGPSEYFGDLWNLMDWLNFLVFFQVWWTLSQMLHMFNDGDPNPPCTELCRTVGYVDFNPNPNPNPNPDPNPNLNPNPNPNPNPTQVQALQPDGQRWLRPDHL